MTDSNSKSDFTRESRYSRQILFPQIGEEGQRRIEGSQVVIVGCGALGTAQANALVRAGVGRLRIVDRDYVEESNLQRQMLFDESDAAENLPKAVAAERKLKTINRLIEVEGVVADLNHRNGEELVKGFDLILDGTDNFETRYLLNELSVREGIPWIYGGAVGSAGSTFTVAPGRTACLSCLFPALPEGLHETCDTVGILSPAASWTAAVQVSEAIKILLGRWESLHGSFLSYDVWENRSGQVRVEPDPNCRVCRRRDFMHLEGRGPTRISLCGRNSVQIHQRGERRLDLEELRKRLEKRGSVRANAYLLRCRLEDYELTVFPDGRTIVKGTQDPAVARSLYARYVSG